MDKVERQYVIALEEAIRDGDTEYIYELLADLQKHRESLRCTNG